MNLDKMYKTDLCKLSDKELASFIKELKHERLLADFMNPVEIAVIVMTAAAEQNSRASARLASRALWIAGASLFVTMFSVMGVAFEIWP